MGASRFATLSLALVVVFCIFSSAYSSPLNFIVTADSRGSINGVNDAVLSRIVDLIGQEDADFVFFPGDLVNGSSTNSVLTSQLNHWRSVMTPIYNSTMYRAKVYAGPGNHEIGSSASEAVWQSIFSDLPSNGPTGETYMTYSFDYLNSHFVMLDTNRAGLSHTINYAWLADDLASTIAEHIFVFGHEPAFPAGPHIGSSLDYYPSQRDAFWQLLSDYNVDIYFAGHEHLYNHIKVGGVHQVITGTSGAPIYTGYGGEFYHYALVTADGPDVFVKIVDDSEGTRDYYYACKNNPVGIEGTPLRYTGIQEAYDSTINGDKIQVQAMVFTENIYIQSDKSVTISGGYNCDYTMNAKETTLNGTMIISSGTVTLENLILQ